MLIITKFYNMERQPMTDLVIDNQHNQEVKAKDSEIEELDYTPLTHDAELEFELQRVNEVYKKNVEVGEKISFILHRGIILEKSLSKQNKFCLDLFQAQKLTINVENAEYRLWQELLLNIIKVDQMEDREIIWVIGKQGNKGKILVSVLHSKFAWKSSCNSF